MYKVVISRKQATSRNIIVSFVFQLITIVLGFLIPQLFLNAYGPNIHGLTSAITNIMSYVLLLIAGLNTASIQALYAPLSKNDSYHINEVLNTVRQYYFYTGIAFTVVISLLALILPLFIKDVSNILVFSLMLVMGLQSTIDCFLVTKYRVLLRADQKLYITMIFNIISLILRGIIQIYLIINGWSVVFVQAIPALMLLVTWALQNAYVKKHYPMLDNKVKPNKSVLSKRWSAFVHQISGLVVNNLDIFLLTTLTGNMVLVSIYSVYQLVFTHLYNFMTTIFSLGSVASFGNLMAIGKDESLRYNYNIYEFLYYNVLSIVYSICAVMILPFVGLYTLGVKDVNYVDTILAILFVTIGITNNLRVPGNTLINAGGYYKETQWRAITEAIINFSVSIILIKFLGVYGVLIGTVVSFAYRTTDIIYYSNRKILKQSPRKTFFRSLRVLFVVLISVLIFNVVLEFNITNWLNWLIISICVGIFSILINLVISIIFERKESKYSLVMVKRIIGK